ncbi:hypothetical protein MIMGU_mgv1a023872mg, partial [Erythranthe guttata]
MSDKTKSFLVFALQLADAFIERNPIACEQPNLENHQSIAECTEKYYHCLGNRLLYVRKRMNKVYMGGRRVPKILDRWSMDATELKYKGSGLLEKLQAGKSDSLTEESEHFDNSTAKILKHCPVKDEYEYDKAIPVVIPTKKDQKFKTSPVGHGGTSFSTNKEEALARLKANPVSGFHDSQQAVESVSKQESLSPSNSQETHKVYKLDDGKTISIPNRPSTSGKLENSSVINLVERDLCQLPEEPDYSNPYFLFLQKNTRLTQIPDSFFNTMPDLIFLDMSDTKIKILPSSLFKLSKLKVLMLRNCFRLAKIPSEIGNLSDMEVLDLSGSELYDLPDEIGELTLLTHLQLSFYGPDDESEFVHLPSKLISPTFLSKIKNLEALNISVHPEDHRWTNDAEPIIKNVAELENLSHLQFYFPKVEMFEDFIQTSPSWKKGILRKFCFVVGCDVKRIASRVPDEVEQLFRKETQSLRFVNGNANQVPQMIQNVLARATSFYLDHHMKVKSLSEFRISNFRLLKFFLLRECPKIQTIVDSSSAGDVFPCLEHLRIYYLWELKHVCEAPSIWTSYFPALTHLTVSTCHKLKFILWESMVPCLPNLKELVVEDCESVEEIVKQEKERAIYTDNGVIRIELSRLVLQYLPKLVSLGNGLSLSEAKIDITGCPRFNLKPKEHAL